MPDSRPIIRLCVVTVGFITGCGSSAVGGAPDAGVEVARDTGATEPADGPTRATTHGDVIDAARGDSRHSVPNESGPGDVSPGDTTSGDVTSTTAGGDAASLNGTILAGHPIYSLVAGATYAGQIVLRVKAAAGAVTWKYAGSSCADAKPLTCLAQPYSVQPHGDVDHDWRCEIDATPATLGSGSVTIRACDGAGDPSVAIQVTGASTGNAFEPGIYVQQRYQDTYIGATQASYVRGGNLLAFWSELQPSLDTFVDTELVWAMSQATWKNWILLVKTGAETSNGTPAWLTAAAPSAGLGRPEHTDNIGTGPYPWDPVYQDLAENLMAHVAAVVGKSSSLAGVYIAGATSHYNEMILPGSSDFTTVHVPAVHGLTSAETVPSLDLTSCDQYIEAWERAIDSMNTQFGVKIITPLDTVPACTGDPNAQNAPYDALKATATTPFSTQTRAFGTVNLGYDVDATSGTIQDPTFWDATPKFFDRMGPNPTSEYWELGPAKMSPGITSSSDMATRIKSTLGYADTYFAADAVTILEATWKFGTDSALVETSICNAVAANPTWWPAGVRPGC